ncbi:hypothetical protein N0V88_002117 [Collariella sp. IMI 366227]|nr:hypothetical protein N0V88_002117 [Collariella sp. IMI 366227]
MATEDARYRQSSQYELWSFSPSQLAAMRETTNTAARSRISQRLATLPAPPSSTSAPTSNANTPDPEGTSTPVLPEFLTPGEEAQLLTFYTAELLRAGEFGNMSDEIKATAAVFFRRFYVTNSVMTYPAPEMLVTALFFAAKAEGSFMSVGEFAKIFGKERPDEILAGEFLLCQGMRFAIDVKHPFRALRGAVMELSTLPGIEHLRLAAAEVRAREILRFSPLITDAYFHYTPSQIMLSALSLADRGLAERLITETFHYVAPTTSGADTPASDGPGNNRRPAPRSGGITVEDKAQIIGSHIRDKVLGTIEACRDMLAKELPERREHWKNRAVIKAQINPLNKKLNKCRDPERWNLVELQRVRREQASKKDGSEDGDAEDRGESDGAVFGDAVPKRKKVKVEDPFGGVL